MYFTKPKGGMCYSIHYYKSSKLNLIAPQFRLGKHVLAFIDHYNHKKVHLNFHEQTLAIYKLEIICLNI